MREGASAPLETLYHAARARGVPFAEDFVPRNGEVHTGQITLRYTEWGDATKPTVLLLHGFAQTSHAWDLVALALADRFHVISLDQRGHGDSEWASDGDYSLEAQQRDLDAALVHLGKQEIIPVGLSMGGRNAYVLAHRRPEIVKALVTVDTGPRTVRRGRSRIRDFVTMPDVLDSFEEFVERVHSYVPHRSMEQIRLSLLNNIRETPEGKWTWKYDRILRDPNYRRPIMDEESAWNIWTSIACPTLLVRGEESDVLDAETAAEMTRRLPGSLHVDIPEAGHLVPGDNPAAFVLAVKPWLETVSYGG
jgi:pimeloyl-ACP methyl ester carboxylesterase